MTKITTTSTAHIVTVSLQFRGDFTVAVPTSVPAEIAVKAAENRLLAKALVTFRNPDSGESELAAIEELANEFQITEQEAEQHFDQVPLPDHGGCGIWSLLQREHIQS